MRMRARTNGEDLIRDLDDYQRIASSVAAPRTVRKVTEQAQVAGLRKINEVYKVSPRDFEKYVRIEGAPGDVSRSIVATGIGLPLYLFNPRPSTPGRNRGKGVTVTIKGQRLTIEGAFIARLRSGRVGVFMRGAYGGKGGVIPTGRRFGPFVQGRGRFPINELRTFGPPEALSNEAVVDAMNARVEEQFPVVFAQEIRFAIRSAGRAGR